ncbi:MAG: hypothetical protein AAGU14_12170 [Eubacteriaceae bacterium]
MSNPVQIELGGIAGFKEEGERIINQIKDTETKSILRKYNELLGNYIYSLSCIISQHENNIKANAHKLEDR